MTPISINSSKLNTLSFKIISETTALISSLMFQKSFAVALSADLKKQVLAKAQSRKLGLAAPACGSQAGAGTPLCAAEGEAASLVSGVALGATGVSATAARERPCFFPTNLVAFCCFWLLLGASAPHAHPPIHNASAPERQYRVREPSLAWRLRPASRPPGPQRSYLLASVEHVGQLCQRDVSVDE